MRGRIPTRPDVKTNPHGHALHARKAMPSTYNPKKERKADARSERSSSDACGRHVPVDSVRVSAVGKKNQRA
jgi:hypothetical protein